MSDAPASVELEVFDGSCTCVAGCGVLSALLSSSKCALVPVPETLQALLRLYPPKGGHSNSEKPLTVSFHHSAA